VGKVSESKRKANDAWDAKNMKVVGCKVKRAVADAFAEYAKRNETTVNALLQKYIFQCVGDTVTDDDGNDNK
jgi:hypothetical protein